MKIRHSTAFLTVATKLLPAQFAMRSLKGIFIPNVGIFYSLAVRITGSVLLIIFLR